MTKTYRDWSTDQTYLFPPSPHEWLPQGDLVYFLLDTVATLDLTPIFAHYERELRGQPPFHPRMMVALLLYCYATGTRSSRRIMRRCHVDVACRVIVGEHAVTSCDTPLWSVAGKDVTTLEGLGSAERSTCATVAGRRPKSPKSPARPRRRPIPTKRSRKPCCARFKGTGPRAATSERVMLHADHLRPAR